MNQIILIGNLGADIELKTTNSGKYVASVNMAVKDDFNKEKTDWIPLVFWNKSAETAAQYTKAQRLLSANCLPEIMRTRKAKNAPPMRLLSSGLNFWMQSKRAAKFWKMEVVDENLTISRFKGGET